LRITQKGILKLIFKKKKTLRLRNLRIHLRTPSLLKAMFLPMHQLKRKKGMCLHLGSTKKRLNQRLRKKRNRSQNKNILNFNRLKFKIKRNRKKMMREKKRIGILRLIFISKIV
jgi:hypothetical protein